MNTSRHHLRPLDKKQGRIDMSHGAGGRATYQLLQEIFRPAFERTWPEGWHDAGDDGVVLSGALQVPAGHDLVMSADAHVVAPLFFPGGDIGSLAVNGTTNDLAMMGARPACLTVTFVLEEGLPLADLQRVAQSMAEAACQASVAIVAGDTKVVERGKGDGLYISTSGLGWRPQGLRLSGSQARPGDAILLSGPVGDHGLAVLSQRQGLQFDSPIVSDCAPLNSLTQAMLATGAQLRVLRDPTRGGVATSLNEIAAASGVGMALNEADVPVSPAVQGACELLGLDPLYMANEGKLLAICANDDAERLLATMRAHPLAQQSCRIGTVTQDPHCFVQMRTRFGGWRMLDWLTGEPLPRIC
ncbi:hydrogenase expression/formation protein HypE [Aquabacterium sp.]|uniref:hydrogenase expression/formation protein HypE n=1 Tax=Aquabacterium sp. TaxID=1872578 RepID=UPI002E305220|nr:hydrogenase expression/formation protein HypE [Aquabacterium sp.]HEX5310725.1 hydrogenase expression/formation protein HypE [Aquabacterium sp.]